MATEGELQDVLPMYIVDAFTEQPFSGNPAAVCLLGHEDLDVATYQQISSEMNLSETAFIKKKTKSQDYKEDVEVEERLLLKSVERDIDDVFIASEATVSLTADQFQSNHEDHDVATYQQISSEINLSDTAFLKKKTKSQDYKEDSSFDLRWFTPKCEVSLCGHATLASAAVLFSVIGNQNSSVTFDTKSGPLMVRKDENLFCLDMPLNKPVPVEKETVKKLESLIKATIGQLPVSSVFYSLTTRKLLLRLDDSIPRSKFEAFLPNFHQMLESDQGSLEVRGVIVTVRGSKESGYLNKNNMSFDFVSRYFAPWVGVNEDPVTGSSHTVLASYWSAVLQKNDMLARQCSLRGGDLRVSVLNDDRVEVAAPASIVLRGQLKYS